MKRRAAQAALGMAVAVAWGTTPVVAQLGEITTLEPIVVDAGSEPRQLLRYEWAAGASESQLMRMAMRAWATVDGMPMTDTTTLTEMQAHYDVVESLADGAARIEMIIEDYALTVTDETTGEVASDDAGFDLRGLSASFMVDTRGFISQLEMDVPDGLAPELTAQLEQTLAVAMPMPEEPVGVGAYWEAPVSLASQGVPAEMLTRVEVLELDEVGAVLGLTMELDPVELEVALIGDLPPEAEAAMERVQTIGDTRIEVLFTSYVPQTTSEFKMALVMSFLAPQGGEAVRMVMEIGSSMELSQERNR